MRTQHLARALHRLSGALPWLAATALVACATSGPPRPEQTVTREEGGFRIEEDVRVGGGVRSDFEEALDLLAREEYERGIALLEGVTEAAPFVTAAHIDLGMAYRRVDRLEEAQESLARAVELNPRHPVAHNELGIALRRTGRFEEARRSYEKALALQPSFHFARRNLAILCDLFLEDLECALESYEAYQAADPGDENVAMWIADLRARLGR